MAIVVESQAYTTFAIAEYVTITKPTGLAVGDLMVAQIVSLGGSSTVLPSGWIQLVYKQSNDFDNEILYKVADSSDVAATNFTFTKSVYGPRNIGGGILRISGASFANSISFFDTDSNTSSVNITYTNIDITPYADSLMIMAIVGDGTTNLTNVSNYAIATDNPTWTESWDFFTTTGNPVGMYLAYGSRSANTATGNPSITGFGVGGQTTSCVLFSINPSKDVTISETLTLTDTAKQDITLNTSDTLTSTDQVETEKKKVWLNEDKHTSTWTNQDKS